MSSTTNSVIATTVVVVIGRWAEDEKVSVRLVVGGMFLALFLAMMDRGGAGKLASRFALFVFIVAAFLYVPTIAYRAGLTKRKPPKWGWK